MILYVEHIGQHNLPLQILDKNCPSSHRPDDGHVEQWNKRDSCTAQSKSRSKYLIPPEKLPNPRSPHATKVKIRIVAQGQQDTETQVNMVSHMMQNMFKLFFRILIETFEYIHIVQSEV